MLTRLIVASYAWLLEIALWLMLAVAGLAGYHGTVPLMHAAGAVPTSEFAWQVVGALVFPVVTFLLLAIATGPLLLLVDIRQSVRSIEARLERGESDRGSLPFERKEPSI
jgi:hypothetical protein